MLSKNEEKTRQLFVFHFIYRQTDAIAHVKLSIRITLTRFIQKHILSSSFHASISSQCNSLRPFFVSPHLSLIINHSNPHHAISFECIFYLAHLASDIVCRVVSIEIAVCLFNLIFCCCFILKSNNNKVFNTMTMMMTMMMCIIFEINRREQEQGKQRGMN